MDAGAPLASPEVRIQFDPDQEHQLRAIEAAVGLFRGQELTASRLELAGSGGLISEFGLGNSLSIANRQIGANLSEIQEQNSIPTELRGELGADGEPSSLDFTVEMETGTGKTYVYLRTILELHRVYGWAKFVIVVPSVAIREGVEASLRLLSDHFADLYDGVHFDTWVYDSKAPGRLRSFAQANYLQILIINIDAFNKTDTNLIFRKQDQMMGHAPIEFLRAAAPIAVLDEPQNMESVAARGAIASLGPLFTLRYSATHLQAYHQVYRLTPAAAYNAGLVKQIEVWSVTEDENANRPYLKLKQVKAGKRSISARIEVDSAAPQGIKRKTLTFSADRVRDLREVTGRSVYDGYVISEIRSGEVEFDNSVVIAEGQAFGPDRDHVQRVQIRTAVAQHLDRELILQRRAESGQIAPMKVLSLFFIDRVDNYWPDDGKFRCWFQEEYRRLAGLPKYSQLDLPPVEAVHDGYFARDRAGRAKDTRGGTLADAEAYELIMRDKERLLSSREPLRFIFTHSALREGWDNPNVFVITTLNESRGEIRKRQEIGRGLRLPVMSNGLRCEDRSVATLSVVANEAYDEFAAQLQQEIEDETGTHFDRAAIKDGRSRRRIELRGGYEVNPVFLTLWKHIRDRTSYQVSYDTAALIEEACRRLAEQPPLDHSYVRATRAALTIDPEEGVVGQVVAEKAPSKLRESFPIPDLISHLTEVLPVGRDSVAKVLLRSGRLAEASINPQQLVDRVQTSIRGALAEQMADGIKYTRRRVDDESAYDLSLFAEHELTGYRDNLVGVTKSIYSDVVYDSDLERRIALALDAREDVELFIKLPGWFEVDTPIGAYNPDWAVVKSTEDGNEALYLVRESKASRDLDLLRPEERLKIRFGEKHFEAIGVAFDVIDDPSQV